MKNENPLQCRFKIQTFDFYLALKEDDLLINILCEDELTKFHTLVNTDTITNNKNLQFFFKNPSELFSYFSSNNSNLKLSNDGVINFTIKMSFGKFQKEYFCQIRTVRQEMEAENVLKIKVQKLQDEVKTLKMENTKFKQKMNQQQQQYNDLKIKMENCSKMIAAKDQIINSIFSQLRHINKWKEQFQSKLLCIQQNKKFVSDELNPHHTKFTQIGNRFKKKVGGSWDVLMCKYPFDVNQHYSYTIKQTRAGSNGSFMYGIGTEALRGMSRAQDNKQFLGYYQNTGNIYCQGSSQKGGSKVKDNDVIVIEIDTKKWKIAWLIQGKKEAEINIPTQLRQKLLYLTIVVFNQAAQIQFL